MNGKQLNFKLHKLCIGSILLSVPTIAQPLTPESDLPQFTTDSIISDTEISDDPHSTKYYDRLNRREAMWHKLLPELHTIQYAGGIGMFSFGFGWDYGKSRQWETHLLFGFLPKRYNYHHYWTFTLRETFLPWRMQLGGKWKMAPLLINLSLNSILHGDFWASQPSRYPKGYYGFSSKVRFHLGIGQRFSYRIPKTKRFINSEVSIYYEISTCDLYVRQKILNSTIALKDIITLGIGVIYTI